LEELRRSTPTSPGEPYPFSASQRGRLTRAIRLLFQSHGYLQVGVRDSTLISADSTEAVLVFRLRPGPQFRVRAITISGNIETKPELMQRELQFAEGEVYSYVRVQESRENLYATTLFRRVVIREENIDLAARSVDLHVAVLERKSAFVEGSVGLGRRDDFEARAVGQWGHRNLWGQGHLIDIQGTVAYNLLRGGDSFYLDGRVRYVDPHFMGTDTRMIPQVARSLDRRIEGVELDKSEINMQALRKSGRFTTIGLGVASQFTTTTLETATDDLLQTRSIQFWLSRNSSDNIFDPRRGDVRSVGLQRAGFGGDNYFNRVAGNYNRYIPWGPVVLAVGIRGGWVESYGASRTDAAASIGLDGVPFEFLFQAGGNSTVRGFDNNALGSPVTVTRFVPGGSEAVVDTAEVNAGRLLMIGNLEARFPLPWMQRWGMRAVVFVDAGNTWSNAPQMRQARWGIRFSQPYWSTADLRWSTGFGLRYPTPVGPIRLDLGLPIKRRQTGVVHLGLGHTF
jgi:outer membrane protein assembly complex protein YaeT